ncbi:MAG: hypothetical protein HY237_02510 [Acidobacteria bacterium]|nr:hypothetical protein [Acidobacteriota bacterium]
MLRALPPAQLDYRPHAKSRSASQLVQLLVYEEQTGIELCEKGEIYWNEPKGFPTLEAMIADFERCHRAPGERLHKLDDEMWNRKAKLLVSGVPVIEATAGALFWMALFDAVHHRGQLGVYLRPMGGKVPSIYGPSADDPGG